MPEENQTSQSLIYVQRELGDQPVRQRAKDGYFDATAMCKAAGKLFADWDRNDGTQELLLAFQTNMGIPISELIQSVRGGPTRGTWIHPKVAISLAMWLSPEFHVKVCNWVYDGTIGAPRPGGPMSRQELDAMIYKNAYEAAFECIRQFIPTITASVTADVQAMGKYLRKELSNATGSIHKHNTSYGTAKATAALLEPQFTRVHEATSAIARIINEVFAHQQQVERMTFTDFLRRLNCKPSPTNKHAGCKFHAMARAFLKRNPSFQIECDGTGSKAHYSTRMVTAIFERDDNGQILFYQITGRNVIDHKPARTNGSESAQSDMFVKH